MQPPDAACSCSSTQLSSSAAPHTARLSVPRYEGDGFGIVQHARDRAGVSGGGRGRAGVGVHRGMLRGRGSPEAMARSRDTWRGAACGQLQTTSPRRPWCLMHVWQGDGACMTSVVQVGNFVLVRVARLG